MRLSQRRLVNPVELGLNDVSINSAVDSNWISCEGFLHMVIDIQYTRSAGSGVQFNLTTRRTAFFANPLYIQTQAISSGTSTLSDLLITKASAVSKNFRYDIPILADTIRIEDLIATGTPDANDKAKVVLEFFYSGYGE